MCIAFLLDFNTLGNMILLLLLSVECVTLVMTVMNATDLIYGLNNHRG